MGDLKVWERERRVAIFSMAQEFHKPNVFKEAVQKAHFDLKVFYGIPPIYTVYRQIYIPRVILSVQGSCTA